MTLLIEEERNEALFSWYQVEQRSFPWRGATDPYRILVSETMLQQTQASRVIHGPRIQLARSSPSRGGQEDRGRWVADHTGSTH